MELPVWFEVGSLVALVLILVADLLLILKRPHIPSTRESTLWVVFYVTLALIFAGMLWLFAGHEFAGQFIAGWLTEYSLSIDNLFVFVLIMGQFAVPRRYQQEVLMVGIIIALVLRGLFILAGAAIIEQFSWVFYIFGAFLIWTAWRQAFPGGGHDDDVKQESFIVRTLRRMVDISDHYDGAKVRTVVNGKKIFTPMIIVFAAIGMTDLLFAIDSIPAIFGITQNPFIVFTANLFALMGLRQLYFLLGDLLDRLKYLHYGIAFILAFIGVKLFFHAMHVNELSFINGGDHIDWAPEISTWMSLGVIVVSMVVATVASLAASARERRAVPAGDAPSTPLEAAEAVAEQKRTPPTVDGP
ncbi:MAG: tellurium resistance protein TerC [Microbacterium sp. SCN 70-200]|uniref:TerC family protein n=1 Tax=unclassified Microbacterium TaxID=2609290 RepID=UPI000869D821|nr:MULTISPECIES: TerC family protein [unclassified Microbacterium]MBN9214430.1 TerC family protein [Microbacterium sp.]ODT40774.1 MAG: tellurium resistance protein TerC [Microbacterium sp. SCN 70-200]OJV83772.1 MAG: tellurium resistance protein TerC [Microbacterium sp. 70-16]